MIRPHRAWVSIIIASILILGVGGLLPVGLAAETPIVANEIIIKLRNGADLPALTAAYGLSPTPLSQFGNQPIYRLRILDGAAPKDRAEALLLDPRVIYAEPNLIEETPEGRGQGSWADASRSEYLAAWAPGRIRLAEAHTLSQGAGITVAVLDTGVDQSHPDLAGHLVAGYDFVDLDTDPSEVGQPGIGVHGHGTHVIGLVASIAPAARIMPLRVLDPAGMGNSWVLAEALQYAVDPDGNPATNDGAAVINLSLSTLERSRLIEDVLKAVACAEPPVSPDDLPCLQPGGRGAVVVTAAGNRGRRDREYPAGLGLNGCLAVGASTPTDTLATFTNRGSWVDVMAPGERIVSLAPGGGYVTWSGTSMAAPIVAGQAALVRARFPTLSTAKVARQIEETAIPMTLVSNSGGKRPVRIDAAAAVARLAV